LKEAIKAKKRERKNEKGGERKRKKCPAKKSTSLPDPRLATVTKYLD